MGGEYEKTFWDALGGKPAVINIGEEDNAVTEEELHAYSFYRVTDESGELACDEITERPLQREMLKTDDSYILELHSEIYIWQGKTSVAFEKRNAMLFAK
jgi:hypothetical protein